MTITIHNYRSGDELRTATPDDIERARSCGARTGSFKDASGVIVYLEGVHFQQGRYVLPSVHLSMYRHTVDGGWIGYRRHEDGSEAGHKVDSLDVLASMLIDVETCAVFDNATFGYMGGFEALPSFGGDDPERAYAVSWDATRMLRRDPDTGDLEIVSRPYYWVVKIEVDPKWIADGFDLTPSRLLNMIGNALPCARESEYSVEVLSRPTPERIRKEQGYSDSE